MKNRIAIALLFCCLFGSRICAQVSHGGKPLFPENAGLRSVGSPGFIEMPAFNVDSVLRLDAADKDKLRGGFQFAYKFHTRIKKGEDGSQFVLADGTKVWQVGIRSAGAYSINLLFSEFQIPRGGKLFIYNPDHSYMIGSFDYRNNSSARVLQVRPVAGEAVIVEYSEPADAEFEGRLTIGEVNHDYRDIFRSNGEPDPDLTNGAFACMPDVVCENVPEAMVRATAMIMIDGKNACTGTLINNETNDQTPYLFTSVHCLNNNFNEGSNLPWEHYVNRAQTIVTFFNYNRPVCGTAMKGSEEMTVAGALPKVILERKDIALLQLQERPPVYYNTYYAAWDAGGFYSSPYTNLHHPLNAVTKYGLCEQDFKQGNFNETYFDRNIHIMIPKWDIGSTYAGSSGSPLFDNKQAFIGGLTGGYSACGTPNPSGTQDYFWGLYFGWNADNQLKSFLDPDNKGISSVVGLDPNRENPIHRISNAHYNGGDHLTTAQYSNSGQGFVFGSNTLGITEFAEEFNLEHTAALYGVYLLIPPVIAPGASDVEIRVYEGENSPERLVATQSFKPQYVKWTSNGFEPATKNMTVATENFVAFDDSVDVNRKFFIAYKLNNSAPGSSFAVYNSDNNVTHPNSAWLKNDRGDWVRSGDYASQPTATSLAIQPWLKYTYKTSIQDVVNVKKLPVHYLRNENRLLLPGQSTEAGQVFLYSVSGQLLQKIAVEKGQNSVPVRMQAPGSIGIVRLVRGNEVYTGKFVY